MSKENKEKKDSKEIIKDADTGKIFLKDVTEVEVDREDLLKKIQYAEDHLARIEEARVRVETEKTELEALLADFDTQVPPQE